MKLSGLRKFIQESGDCRVVLRSDVVYIGKSGAAGEHSACLRRWSGGKGTELKTGKPGALREHFAQIGGRGAVSAVQPAAQGRNRRGRDLCLQTGIFRHGRIDLLPALLQVPLQQPLLLQLPQYLVASQFLLLLQEHFSAMQLAMVLR